tara:strand:+ start:866 stop:1306 length:441 start_codon:yes stop_codon:yes gene_type:complete
VEFEIEHDPMPILAKGPDELRAFSGKEFEADFNEIDGIGRLRCQALCIGSIIDVEGEDEIHKVLLAVGFSCPEEVQIAQQKTKSEPPIGQGDLTEGRSHQLGNRGALTMLDQRTKSFGTAKIGIPTALSDLGDVFNLWAMGGQGPI